MRSLSFLAFFFLDGVFVANARSQARDVDEHHSNKNKNNRELLLLPNGKSACELVEPLPSECSCSEPGPYSLVIDCLKIFRNAYFNDTVGMRINFDPCDPKGSSMSLDITELDHNIDYPIEEIRAGEEKNFPLPGLSVHVPGIANLGLDATVLISGNLDMLKLKVGLNACAGIHTKMICASSIPGLNRILPWWVLKGKYSFGNFCNDTAIADAAVAEIA